MSGLLLKTINFRNFDKWYVEYYLKRINISTSFNSILLREILSPVKRLVKKENYKGDIPIVEKIVFKTGKIVFRDEKSSGMNLYELENGEVLISNINFHQGATALNTFGKIVASTHYQPYRIIDKNIDPDYLIMILRSELFLKMVAGQKAQGIKNESGADFIGGFSIPVPPKNVQEKLVANYNATMVQAKNAEEKASKYESEIEKYLFSELGISQKENNKERSSVLQTILFSELSYWDIKHSSDSITPQNLLKSSKYPNVNLLSQYQMNPRTIFPENLKQIAFLPMECISDIYGEVLTQQEIDSKTKGYTKFQNNDVIFAKITPCMQNGKCAVLKNLNTGYGLGSTEFHVFRTLSKNDSPDYLHNLLRTKLLRNTAMKYFTGSSGQQRVSSDFFKTLMIPLPPIEIQNEIVNHIDGIKEEIKKLREQAQNLRQKAKKDFEESVFDE